MSIVCEPIHPLRSASTRHRFRLSVVPVFLSSFVVTRLGSSVCE